MTDTAKSAVTAEMGRFTYTNWRGETSERTIQPKYVWFGSTEWHPEPQWLLTAFDLEKNAHRDFALKDFGHPPPVAALSHPEGKTETPAQTPSHSEGGAMVIITRHRLDLMVKALLSANAKNESEFTSSMNDLLILKCEVLDIVEATLATEGSQQ